MKVAFVEPPNVQRAGDWKKMRVSRPPINLALLASYIRQFKHQPFIYDLDWFEGPVEEMAKLILSENPDVVGFTCLTPRIKIVLSIARAIKGMKPDAKVVLGGIHVNAVKGQSLYSDDIDYAIYGESEGALVEFLESLQKGGNIKRVQNLIYRENGNVVVNPARPSIQNLEELPFPAWDLLDLETYIDPTVFDGKHMGVMTSRGCPWNCLFCSSSVTWGRAVRFRSADNVIDELEHIVDKLGINNIMFYDDTFTLNRPRFLKMCYEMVRRNLNLKYYAQIRVDTVDREVADALAESGCITAAIGVESGDDEILKILRKGFTKDQICKAVKILKAAGVPILATYVLGSPGETREAVEKTFEFAKELDVNQTKFMICTPFPGTEIFNIAVERGLLPSYLTPEQYAEFTYYHHVAANLSNMSDEQLLNYQKLAYEIFKPRPMIPSGKTSHG